MTPTARRLVALMTVLTVALWAAVLPAPASAQIPYINAIFNEPRYTAIVVDANTGEVLYSKRADSQRYPASITKIMTLYLTFEALQSGRLHLDDRLTISAHANSMAPTKLGLGVGAQIRVDDAIRALAVKSANDMAVALAERIGGSESRFAALMTLRAQELGMANSQFVNASGLPDRRQLSTSRDIALLSRAVMRDYPQYYGYFGIHRFTYRGETMTNHNHLLDTMPGVDGLKTGFTNASGYNLAASAVRNGRRLIAVVMGGNSWAARDANVADLLNTGFEVLRRRDLGEKITIAQSLFEPEPNGPIVAPGAVEQGDAESHGVHIQLGDDEAEGAPAHGRR
jgi:D-alanyl-D-alanine carboxypeptidase (penicillin-binding protein 5/6)